MEKVAKTGSVTLKSAGRSMMVESREDGDVEIAPAVVERPGPVLSDAPRWTRRRVDARVADDDAGRHPRDAAGVHEASPAPRWPMYVRQAKQFLKTRIDGFDERKYGFASVVDLLRAAAKDGVLKLERDRHGAFRVFAGRR